MFPEKLAKSHYVKLMRMLDDIERAGKDMEVLRRGFEHVAVEFDLAPHDSASHSSTIVPCVPGEQQAMRCADILRAHAQLKVDIDTALMEGTDGKQVAALQLHLDALEDERETLDSDLKSTRRCLAMMRPLDLEDPP